MCHKACLHLPRSCLGWCKGACQLTEAKSSNCTTLGRYVRLAKGSQCRGLERVRGRWNEGGMGREEGMGERAGGWTGHCFHHCSCLFQLRIELRYPLSCLEGQAKLHSPESHSLVLESQVIVQYFYFVSMLEQAYPICPNA